MVDVFFSTSTTQEEKTALRASVQAQTIALQYPGCAAEAVEPLLKTPPYQRPPVVFRAQRKKTHHAGRYLCALPPAGASPLTPTALEQAVFRLEHEGLAAVSAADIGDEMPKPAKDRVIRRCRMPGGALAFLPRTERTGPTLLLAMGIIVDGGGERLTAGVVAHLVARGWRVIVVSTDPEPTENRIPVSWFSKSTPEVFQMPRFLGHPLDRSAFLRYLLHTRQVDVLWQAGSRLVYDMLPQIREEFPCCAVADILFNDRGHMDCNRRHAAELDYVITENAEVASCLFARGESRERVVTIASGVGQLAPKIPAEELRERLGIPQSAVVAGFSGRLSPEKAPEVFVEIAAACRDVSNLHFVMTGKGPEEATVRAAVAALAPERFSFMGHIDDIASYFCMYDALLLPSRVDGRPLAVMEAMSLGTPCLASAIGGMPEMIADGENGLLLPAANAPAFAAALRTLAKDAAKLKDMGRAARQIAQERFSLDSMLQSYEVFFQRMLSLPRRQQ